MKAEEALAESDGKLLDPHAKILGRRVVAELVQQDHDSEHDPHDANGMKDGQELGHTNQITPQKNSLGNGSDGRCRPAALPDHVACQTARLRIANQDLFNRR